MSLMAGLGSMCTAAGWAVGSWGVLCKVAGSDAPGVLCADLAAGVEGEPSMLACTRAVIAASRSALVLAACAGSEHSSERCR